MLRQTAAPVRKHMERKVRTQAYPKGIGRMVAGNARLEQSTRCEQRRHELSARKVLDRKVMASQGLNRGMSLYGNIEVATAKSLPLCKAVLLRNQESAARGDWQQSSQINGCRRYVVPQGIVITIQNSAYRRNHIKISPEMREILLFIMV